MENKEHQTKILKELSTTDYGLSLSDLRRELGLSKDQVRISISFLLGAKKIKQYSFGMSKIYCIPRNEFMGDND